MATASMVTVLDARDRARKRVDQDQRGWAGSGGEDARLDVVLHPPTERAVLAVGQDAAISWARAWRAVADANPGIAVQWGTRQWPSVGQQVVPERCVIVGADAIAGFAGAAPERQWKVLRDRAALLRREFVAGPITGPATGPAAGPAAGPATADALGLAIRANARTLQGLTDADFTILVRVVAWLTEHPASGWRIRQLPIRGIDTKWLERHRSVVEGLHTAATGRLSLGLLDAPGLVRVRFLDPAARPGGLSDVTAPVSELASMDVAPHVVFVFENLETVLAMPEWAGAVVVHGGGYAANRLAGIPWIGSGRVLYWGDLDSDGFAILHSLRSGCRDVTSVLMDEETLLAYRDLWVPEPKAAVGTYPTLTDAEQSTLQRIRSEGNVRLEQERIPWGHALAALVAAAAVATPVSATPVSRHPPLSPRSPSEVCPTG
jgi:hypothetical protein